MDEIFCEDWAHERHDFKVRITLSLLVLKKNLPFGVKNCVKCRATETRRGKLARKLVVTFSLFLDRESSKTVMIRRAVVMIARFFFVNLFTKNTNT